MCKPLAPIRYMPDEYDIFKADGEFFVQHKPCGEFTLRSSRGYADAWAENHKCKEER